MDTYKIMMLIPNQGSTLFKDNVEGLYEADRICRVLKSRNGDCRYYIINKANNDMEGGLY